MAADNYVQGVITLVAVALGAGATFLATQGIERTRWKRERQERWDARRLEAYTDYAAAVKMAIIRSRSILGSIGLSPTLTPISRDEGLPLLALDENSRSTKLEAVMVLANEQTIEAARNWHGLAWRFQHWAMGTSTTTAEEVERAYRDAQVARERYYAAVRAELEIYISGEGVSDDGVART